MADNNGVKKQFMDALFRFKKLGAAFHTKTDINMRELFMMQSIRENAMRQKNNIDMPDIQSNLHVTQAAVSQMLNSLEKKGYIIRDIDKTNRRKITVMLTQKGEVLLDNTIGEHERMMEKIFSRYGEDNTKQLIALLNRLSDVADEIKSEVNNKGDDVL